MSIASPLPDSGVSTTAFMIGPKVASDMITRICASVRSLIHCLTSFVVATRTWLLFVYVYCCLPATENLHSTKSNPVMSIPPLVNRTSSLMQPNSGLLLYFMLRIACMVTLLDSCRVAQLLGSLARD